MNDTAKTKIETIIKEHDVVLFMKGTAKMPQCGFSSRVAGILNYLQINSLQGLHQILMDP